MQQLLWGSLRRLRSPWVFLHVAMRGRSCSILSPTLKTLGVREEGFAAVWVSFPLSFPRPGGRFGQRRWMGTRFARFAVVRSSELTAVAGLGCRLAVRRSFWLLVAVRYLRVPLFYLGVLWESHMYAIAADRGDGWVGVRGWPC